MTQPTKGQLIRDWQIATGDAMQALLQWQKQLEVWISQEVITDWEFMTAFGNLVNEIGTDWADSIFPPQKGIDALRKTLTGVEPAGQAAFGDEWAPYVGGDFNDCASEEGGLERGIDPILWAEEIESEYI